MLEDDLALRQMLVWELSELGYRVFATSSCREARAAAEAQGFDFGLFDVGLPDGDGAELAADLIAARPDLRIVLCSAKPSTPGGKPAFPKVLASLTKPVSIHRLDTLFRSRNQPQTGSR